MAMKLKCCFCGGIGHEIKQCDSFGEVKKVARRLGYSKEFAKVTRAPLKSLDSQNSDTKEESSMQLGKS
jgi:hypothetical protein